MALVTLQECLDYCDVDELEFDIQGYNNVLYFKYDGGSATECELTNDTYDGNALATHLKTVLDTKFSATFTVTWSSTTYKFTIVHATKTIQYIHSNSTAGYTIGFTEDSSAAVSITSDTAASDPTSIISTLRTQADKFVKEFCHRDFESASYTQEIYNGTDEKYIFLNQYPITVISRIAIGTDDIISVYNDNTTSYATVSFDGTNVSLNYNGTPVTLAIATYTTLQTLVAAIEAETNWNAEISSTDYNATLSSELLKEYGLSCLDSQRAYLRIRNPQQANFRPDLNTGKIYLTNIASGNQNIIVDYTAGFSTIPEDLKMAVLIYVKYLYAKWQDDSFGLEGFKIGKISKFRTDEIPKEVLSVLFRYMNWNI